MKKNKNIIFSLNSFESIQSYGELLKIKNPNPLSEKP